jgi:hypothetical protein
MMRGSVCMSRGALPHVCYSLHISKALRAAGLSFGMWSCGAGSWNGKRYVFHVTFCTLHPEP